MNIENSWLSAEKKCFELLVTGLEAKDGFDAFRGYLPDLRDSWMFTSGGMQTGPIERLYSETGAWCSLSVKARVEGIFKNRDDALRLGGKILKVLKDTGNMHQELNVMWLRLTDLPGEPDEFAVMNLQGELAAVMWRITIPLEMVFATAAEYPVT
jgi:hypothetical protein